MEVIVEKSAFSGNRGPDVRSDCYVALTLKRSGGREFSINSKVGVLYGSSIKKLLTDILDFYDIKNIKVEFEDSGAIPCVIAARMEAAAMKLMITDREFLLSLIDANKYSTQRDRRRFSRLYLPGDSPKLMINAGIHKPDGIILDLEDSVAPDKKHDARHLVRNALRQIDFYGAERMVRINQIPAGLEDLDFIIPHNVNLVLIPKCEDKKQVKLVEEKIEKIKKEKKIKSDIWLMPVIESALGVIKSYEIATASKNIVSLAIGLEDYTADLGTRRTDEGRESFFARSQVVNAARAAGVQPIDSVFSDVSDMEALKNTVLESKSLGFEGMGCIHPRQISVIHEYYSPDEAEIEKAKKIVQAFNEAQEKGLGVVSLGTKMIDPPVVKRAQRTVNLAIKVGKLEEGG